jgi:methionyl-tRNA formyltransferase
MKCVLVGAVESSRLTLHALLRHGFEVAAVLTVPAAGAAQHSDYVDLASDAEARAIPVVRTMDVNSPSVIEKLEAIAPDVIFVIGWSRLCSRRFLQTAATGALGYHPTLLPAMRGRSPLAWTILLGLRRSGGSLFWLDEGVDSGPIADQEAFDLDPDIDLPNLYAAQMGALSRMWDRLLPQLRVGGRPARPQHAADATFLARRRPEDGEIDWRLPADAIARLVRAVTLPYPGAFTYSGGAKLFVWKAKPIEAGRWHAQVGQVFMEQEGCPVVRCGEGTALMIEAYELENGGSLVVRRQPRLGR